MFVSIPFRVEYRTAEAAPIPDIIASLQSLQSTLEEAGKNLENFVPGLTIEKVEVKVEEISHGSLRELLLVGLFFVFQEPLEDNLPVLVSELTGQTVPESAETLLVVLALVAIVYGADMLQKIARNEIQDTPTLLWKKHLIKDLAAKTGKTEAEVKKVLDKRYGVKSRAKTLRDNTVKFFTPSKRQDNAEIKVNKIVIDQQKVADIPDSFITEKEENAESFKHFYGVELDVHAQDKDREASGWAAIPVDLHHKRLRMKLLEAATPEQLWGKDTITGDIILISKRVGLDFEPSEIHLVKVYD